MTAPVSRQLATYAGVGALATVAHYAIPIALVALAGFCATYALMALLVAGLDAPRLPTQAGHHRAGDVRDLRVEQGVDVWRPVTSGRAGPQPILRCHSSATGEPCIAARREERRPEQPSSCVV
ncbi:MAG: hypothetical protein N2444_01805 [Methylocystis sp.]|nr:hypothetical protein [Methylocystis sp.]